MVAETAIPKRAARTTIHRSSTSRVAATCVVAVRCSPSAKYPVTLRGHAQSTVKAQSPFT